MATTMAMARISTNSISIAPSRHRPVRLGMLRRPAASVVGRDTIVPNSQDCKLNNLTRVSGRGPSTTSRGRKQRDTNDVGKSLPPPDRTMTKKKRLPAPRSAPRSTPPGRGIGRGVAHPSDDHAVHVDKAPLARRADPPDGLRGSPDRAQADFAILSTPSAFKTRPKFPIEAANDRPHPTYRARFFGCPGSWRGRRRGPNHVPPNCIATAVRGQSGPTGARGPRGSISCAADRSRARHRRDRQTHQPGNGRRYRIDDRWLATRARSPGKRPSPRRGALRTVKCHPRPVTAPSFGGRRFPKPPPAPS